MKKFHNEYDCEEFEFEGKRAIIVFPNCADKKKHWLLKTEYWDAFPAAELEMLKLGFHLAYVENENRFATYEDCERKSRFVPFISEKYGLCERCVPVGYSCGGAHAINFAGFFPQCVSCLYIDAPVLNFCDYPARHGSEECERVWDNEFVRAYPGITRAKLTDFSNHPLGKIPTLIEHKIPIIMLYGTEDTTVDYNLNGRLLEEEYADFPELLTVIPIRYRGHHPHGGIEVPTQLTEFLKNNG